MDHRRFDDVTRALPGYRHRRGFLAGLLAALGVASLGSAPSPDDAAAKKKKGRKKRCGKGKVRCGKKKCVKGICCPGTLCGGDPDCVCGRTTEGKTICVSPVALCIQCESSEACADNEDCVLEDDCGDAITAVCKSVCAA